MVEPLVQVPKYYGLYEGVVTKVEDPKTLARVKVRVREIMGDKESAWARVLSPYGGPSRGFLAIPEPGDGVEVMFEAGDSNRPVVMGGLWYAPGDKSSIPQAAREKETGGPTRGADAATGALGAVLTEPVDARAPTYPNNKVFVSKNHTMEFDDTPGKERISLTHRKAKVYIDVYQDGTIVVGTPGKRYTVIGGDDAEHVKGKKDVVVDGDFSLKSQNQNIEANNRTVLLQEDKLSATKMTVEVAGQLDITAAIASITAALVTLGAGVAPAPVVTTKTHPFDYITGIPIDGEATVLAG